MHLTLETLARLVDEEATPAEAEHLRRCVSCREELETLRDEVAALAELPRLVPPPPSAWPALEKRLRAEGLIAPAPEAGRVPEAARPSPWGGARLLRLAAAIALFLLGGGAGFAAHAALDAGAADSGPGGAIASPATTVEDAARQLAEAEAVYRSALARYNELAGVPIMGDPLTRLATLETILLTTGEALSASPADPVINGYHLTALAQREATMQQLVLASDEKWY